MSDSKRRNAGFSLVELIIVIAIMVVLVGVLAPQMVKYVKKARISTDVSSADELALAFNTAFTDPDTAASDLTTMKNATVGTDITALLGKTTAGTANAIDTIDAFPTLKACSATTGDWQFVVDSTYGLKYINIKGTKVMQIWPSAATAATANTNASAVYNLEALK